MKIPDIAEQRAIKLFTKEFGDDIVTRYKKFQEEQKELDEVFQECFVTGIMTPDLHKHLLDELSDVQGTFTHLASLMGLYQREMLHNCIDKVTTRKTNPDYKRFSESKMKTVEYADGLKVSYIPVSEFDDFDKTKPNSLTATRTSFKATGHPVAVQEDNYWIKPDPDFYSTSEDVIDAWRRYYEDRTSVKMVKCNEHGIITGSDTHALFENGINLKYPILPPELKD